MLHHVVFKTNLETFSRACYGISNIWSHANLYTMIDFALFAHIHTSIVTNWTHTLHCLLAGLAFLTFFGHFVKRVCSEVPSLNNGHVAEKVWALSELILMCNTSVLYWFNIVKRDLTEESLGQRAWSQLWQGTPISEHCGLWWPQYSRHCGHYYATKVNSATLHCDQAKVYYGVLLSSTMCVFLVHSSWHHRIMLLIKVGGPLGSSTRQDYSIFSITYTIRL